LYLRNWSPTTVRTYRQGLRRLGIEVPTKTDLDAWVIRMRQDGLTPGGCNMYIRTINAYLTWLHEEGTIDQRLRVKVLRAPLKQIRLLADAEIRLLLNYRPRRRTDRRTWTLTLLLLDTGLRIAEALSLERSRIDLDQMTLIVVGKGNKERMVPFSVELRKVLYRWLKAPHGRSTRYAFSSFAGLPLTTRNAAREITTLAVRTGVVTHIHPHLLRHQFAATYMRRGGELYRLSRLLGHTSVSTTQMYLRALGIAELREGTERLTPLRLG